MSLKGGKGGRNRMHWRELEVWKLSHEMVLDVYRLSNTFPDHEKFRLTGQLCRAACSVPANIVEGNSRYSRKEYIQFRIIARASLEEARYHGLLAKDLQYIESSDYDQLKQKPKKLAECSIHSYDPSESKQTVIQKSNPSMDRVRRFFHPITPLPRYAGLSRYPPTPLGIA
jgi:four helix bundle protein